MPRTIVVKGRDAYARVMAALGQPMGKRTDKIIVKGKHSYVQVLSALVKAFNPDEARDEKGEWSSGSGLAGIDINSKGLRSVKEAVDRGAWNFQRKDRTQSMYGSSDTKSFAIVPNDVPKDWQTFTKPSGRTEVFDPKYAHAGEFGAELNDPNANKFPVTQAEPGLIYRGMSHEEYQEALRTGAITSRGGYNLGEDEKGLTYFSSDPQQAAHYASSFAPWQYIPTPTRPAVVVAVKDPGNHVVHGAQPTELGIKTAVPISDIAHVFVGRPAIMTAGDVDVIQRRGSPDLEGSRSSPSAYVVWSRHEGPIVKFDPDEARDYHGRWGEGGAPVSQAFNDMCHSMVQRLFPNGYDVSDNAPNTYEALVKQMSGPNARMVVYSGASNQTVFADAKANYDFRAWHDYCHLRGAGNFTPEGEQKAFEEQSSDVRRYWGYTPEANQAVDLLHEEIVGQLQYAQAHNNNFPVNQRAFAEDYLKNPTKAVHGDYGASAIAKGTPQDDANWGRLRDVGKPRTAPSMAARVLAYKLRMNEMRMLLHKYSPDEARDDHGMWTVGGVSADEAASLKVYGGPQYHDINHALRHQTTMPKELQQHLKNLDAVFARSATPKQQNVWRVFTPEQYKAFNLDKLAQGSTFTDHAFTSTTTSPTRITNELKGGVAVQIIVPKGYPAIKLGEHATVAQREITLDRDTTFKIKEPKKYFMSGGKKTPSDDPVVLEVVPKAKVKKYSPDQERDDHGRFAGDGGSGGGSSSGVERIGTSSPEGKAPNVDWHAQDLQDSSKVVNAASIARDYGHDYAATKGQTPTVYEAYIPLSQLDESLAEENLTEAEIADGLTNEVDWSDFQGSQGSFPPIKVMVLDDGKPQIIDGNHRVRWWRDHKNLDSAPAWVLDYRKGVKVKKYSPDQVRDDHGRFSTGSATTFVSPNVQYLDLKGAQNALTGERHALLKQAWADVDQTMGLRTETHDVIGAWKDGAENSVMTVAQNVNMAQLEASAAMKGYLGNQKSVLLFDAISPGPDFLMDFHSVGSVKDIHDKLLAAGLENHTLEPTNTGARVFVFAQTYDDADKVARFANVEGTTVEVHTGHGEFIGDTDGSGDDAEQRARARENYANILGSSGLPGVAAQWQKLRDRWLSSAEAVKRLLKYSDDQPRDYHGRWATEGSENPGHGYSKDAHLIGGKIYTNNVYDAVRALYQDKPVVLNQPREVSTLIDKLGEVSARMIALGGKVPNFNLCNVSVRGTNLFCADTAGIPRAQMPQLRHKEQEFRDHLTKMGVTFEDTEEKASHLRASQAELNGARVAGVARNIAAGGPDVERLFVSKDNYIVDGHHRWAALVGIDARNNKFGDINIPITRVNMNIVPLIREARKVSTDAHLNEMTPEEFNRRVRKLRDTSLAMLALLLKYSPDQGRDYHGRFTTGGGAGLSETRDRKRDWVAHNPMTTLQENMSAAANNQHLLADAGNKLASMHEGVKFIDPGPKTSVSRITEKAKTRGFGGITDYTRGSFIVNTPEQASTLVGQLREHFGEDNVVDEGWKRTPVDYMDRTALVRYKDGQVGELQFMSPEMSEAKYGSGKGHDMYYHSRSLPVGDKLRETWEARMGALYKGVLNSQGDDWKAVAGRAIRTFAKSFLKTPSLTTRPSMATSAEST